MMLAVMLEETMREADVGENRGRGSAVETCITLSSEAGWLQ